MDFDPKELISENPMAALVAMAVLVVLVLVLAYYTYTYKSQCTATKSGFYGSRGLSPNWRYGNMDAGYGGSMHREPTYYNMLPFMSSYAAQAARDREGQTKITAAPGTTCASGEAPIVYQDEDGAQVTYCPFSSEMVKGGTCSGPWDHQATMEAQGLAQVGAFADYDGYGEQSLQHAIHSAYDNNYNPYTAQITAMYNAKPKVKQTTTSAAALTDASLQSVMHNG